MTNLVDVKNIGPLALAIFVALAPSAHATSDGCAVVSDAPDGFIELKEAPGRRFGTIMRLLPGEKLWVDTARCTSVTGEQVCDEAAEWWHVTSVPRLDDQEGKRAAEPIFTKGWAEKRFLKTYDCEDE